MHESQRRGRAWVLQEQECLCPASVHVCVHAHPGGRVHLLESCLVSGGLVNSSRSGDVLLGHHVPGVNAAMDACFKQRKKPLSCVCFLACVDENIVSDFYDSLNNQRRNA